MALGDTRVGSPPLTRTAYTLDVTYSRAVASFRSVAGNTIDDPSGAQVNPPVIEKPEPAASFVPASTLRAFLSPATSTIQMCAFESSFHTSKFRIGNVS